MGLIVELGDAGAIWSDEVQVDDGAVLAAETSPVVSAATSTMVSKAARSLATNSASATYA
jgi:hypothetical protein